MRIHTISATVTVVAALLFSFVGAVNAQVSVVTYHNDNARTGQTLNETVLTPSTVSPGAFGRRFAYAVDGYVYAQPLYLSGVSIPGLGARNAVYVATEHNSVYAFDADDSTVGQLWHVSFINPAQKVTTVPAGDVNSSTNPGWDIVPEIGITGTPVIDPQTETLYVVALTKEVVGGQAHHRWRLHALDVATGAEKFGGPALIADAILTGTYMTGGSSTYVSGPVVNGSAFDAVAEFNRAGLLLHNGVVYIAWASHGDTFFYSGWVTGFDAQTLQLVAAFNAAPTGAMGGIWMGGGGPAVDSGGAIYLSTGNGIFDVAGQSPAYGQAVLKLSPGTELTVSDFFTPWNQASLSTNDQDLSAGGVVVLPDQAGTHPHLLVAAGKEGKIYLINRDDLGNYQRCGAHCDAVVQTVPLGSPIFDVPAYFNGRLYYQGLNDVLKAFQLSNGQLSSTPVSQSSTTFGFPGATPSVSANGSNDGIVWAVQVDGYATGGAAVLHAYDAGDLSRELYNSSMVASDQLESGVKFSVPTVANGKVYVGTQSTLVAFGLGSSSGTLGAPTNLTATAVSSSQINLSWTAASGAVTAYLVERCPGSGCSSFVQVATETGTTYSDPALAAGTSYRYRVRATDAAANLSGYSNTATATTLSGSDTTAPTVPSGLRASVASSSRINLAWKGSTDNVGVTAYLVERCQGKGCTGFSQVATVPGTTYSDTGLAAATSYSYRVRATDAAGKLSGYSNTNTATTRRK